jgi:hypothetical protein
MDTTKPLTLDPELAELLKQAAAAGRSVAVSIDDRTYNLSVTPAPDIETADLWANYDPERVRAAVRRSAALPSSVDPGELDSDVLIYYTNVVTSIHEMIARLAPAGLAVSAVSYMETQQGVQRSPVPQDAQTRLDELLEWVPIVAFSRAEARRCADVRECCGVRASEHWT